MSIPAGARVGRYQIRCKIGEGGMGEVYRATDSTLGRDVAIKVLPAAFCTSPEPLHRLAQEARAIGALNHPNILAVHDVDTDHRPPYVVSELLEGETIREHLARGAWPVERAVAIALQMAEGLAAAHEKGIIHRDLKPENLFLTRDGRLKILDFGLAKLMRAEVEPAEPSTGTISDVHTAPGSVMGTVGYMSPEQARGQPLDQRSDLFSFGAVLYEMLFGTRAFPGNSAVDTLAAILSEDPPKPSSEQQNIDPALWRTLSRCLEKQREQRFHSASDLGFALQTLSSASAAAAPAAPIRRWRAWGWSGYLPWITAAVLLISSLALLAVVTRRAEPAVKTIRFNLLPPSDGSYGDGLSLSPGGDALAFTTVGRAGLPVLWVRRFDALAATDLPNTDGAALPFWSPDGRFIAFFADGQLKKIAASGGPPEALADVADARGGAWGPDGTILFAAGFTGGLKKVPSGGGAAVAVTALDGSRQQTSHRWPSFLPDGRRFLYFSRSTERGSEGIYVGSLDSAERHFVVNTTSLALYAAPGRGMPGHLLFMRQGTLVAQAFDPSASRLEGEPIVLAQGVLNFPGETGPTGYAGFSVSHSGHLAYTTGIPPQTQIGWFDRKGRSLGAVLPPGDYHEPSLSPDGKRLVLGREDGDTSDVWILDTAKGGLKRFTFDPAVDVCPLWSPDGSRVVFSSSRAGQHQLYQKLSSGSGADGVLLRTATNAFVNDWKTTNAGSWILYEVESPETRLDLYVLPLVGNQKPFAYLQTEFNETHSQFSPDGRWVAYTSDESGRPEVYVQSFPVSGGKWQVSAAGGDQAHWRQDGSELFYMAADRTLMAVGVSAAPSFQAGSPAPLFATHVPKTGPTDDRNSFVPSADGQRFLINNLVPAGTPPPITMVLNWAAELKKAP